MWELFTELGKSGGLDKRNKAHKGASEANKWPEKPSWAATTKKKQTSPPKGLSKATKQKNEKARS